MIIVAVSGVTAAGGSFYVDSPANGNWEKFITEDVVDYVDTNFRTIPEVESRGIFGGSMGGFGALNLAMRHPDLYSAAYASTPGLLDDGGVDQMGFFDSEEQISRGTRHPRDRVGPRGRGGIRSPRATQLRGAARVRIRPRVRPVHASLRTWSSLSRGPTATS